MGRYCSYLLPIRMVEHSNLSQPNPVADLTPLPVSELEVNPQAEKIPSSVKSVAISEHSSL